MVGISALGSKATPREPRSPHIFSPPSPYKQASNSPVILTETTTTTQVVTTTTHTTHFFSLPLWRKRSAYKSSPSVTPVTDFGVHENDVHIRETTPRILMVEKDLPPTPPGEAISEDVNDTNVTRTSTTKSIPLQPFPSSETPKSTYILAHAALGIGLPHVMPQTSPSSSTTEVNTLGFRPTPSTTASSTLGMRRSKSTHKLKPKNTSFRPSTPDEGSGRRLRGLSFGTQSHLFFPTDDKGKGKEKQLAGQSAPSSPKTISRRPSFWSRKKSSSSHNVAAPPDSLNIASASPSLPSLPPLSPFFMDNRMRASPESHPRRFESQTNTQHERRRSSSISSPSEKPFIVDFSQPLSRKRRPATADSSTRSPTRPFFSSPRLTSSSLASPPADKLHEPSILSRAPIARPRSQTNPLSLHRLSLNLFSTSGTQSQSSPVIMSPAVSDRTSPRTSVSKRIDIPKPQDSGESPEGYLTRLRASVSKAEIAGILAASPDTFYVRALRAYISKFDFRDDPLDVALRKLLMDVGLPRETQQIDRVIDAFAARYLQCNPDIFASDDHPYILAFSLIMLHTDAFNKSNKRKMNKADYIRNTRLPGVTPEILDYFYDNIVFAPFIFIEDPLDVNGQRGLMAEASSSRMSSVGTLTNANNVTSPSLGKGNKVDPYYLITRGLLAPLRVQVESHVPLANPYSYKGTAGSWDEKELQRAFTQARVLEIASIDQSRASPFFGLSVGGAPSPLLGNMVVFPEVLVPVCKDVWPLKVAKVGLLNRKDDFLQGGKRAMNRKWRQWSVILTGSQLLLFRDSSWATALLSHDELSDRQVIYPQASVFKPDELLSVKEAIAVYDRLYTKYDNTLRLAMPDGRQFLLQASDKAELNAWISRINYASAFKSAGVRMRPLGMSGRDVQLTGVAAATSHLHDMQHRAFSPSSNIQRWDSDTSRDLMDMLSTSPQPGRPTPHRRVTLVSDSQDVDIDVPTAPEIDGADQFKATFDQVKAELAAGHWNVSNENLIETSQDPLSTPLTPLPCCDDKSRLSPRSRIILSKIEDLESKISVVQSQLDADLRFVRNIAVLSPFQKSTRERLEMAVQSIAKRVMQMRLDLTKFECHRDVLSMDLAAEKRDWHQGKTLALKAATETLQNRRGNPVPYMETTSTPSVPVPQGSSSPSSRRPESSTCESFHSAIDFGPDWPSSEDLGSSCLTASRLFDSPERNSSGSSASFHFSETDSHSFGPLPQSEQNSPCMASPRSSSETQMHEKFYTAQESPDEEAEDWNKTRCAQRVSLVRLPSDIRISSFFQTYNQHHDTPATYDTRPPLDFSHVA